MRECFDQTENAMNEDNQQIQRDVAASNGPVRQLNVPFPGQKDLCVRNLIAWERSKFPTKFTGERKPLAR
jgi:hypothetical protein